MDSFKTMSKIEWTSSSEGEADEKIIIGKDICKSSNLRMIRIMPRSKSIPHSHPQLQAFYIISGKARITVEDQEIEVGENVRVIVKPNQLHSITVIGETPLIAIVFDEFDQCFDFSSPYVDF